MLKRLPKPLLALLPLLAVAAISVHLLVAQSGTPTAAPDCDLAAEQAQLSSELATMPTSDKNATLAKLYQIGTAYQDLALRCGYQPTATELDALAQTARQYVSRDILAAIDSVGTDVPAITAQLAEVPGNPITGQELYNGLQPGGDGTTLGCSGCHEEGTVAPRTGGTWTRVTEERLQLPQFTDYTFEQYVIESIVLPNAYIAPNFHPNLMPDNFGTRLTVQNLADLVAYLSSQDQ